MEFFQSSKIVYGHEMCQKHASNHVCIGKMSIKALATMIIPLSNMQPKNIHNGFHTQFQWHTRIWFNSQIHFIIPLVSKYTFGNELIILSIQLLSVRTTYITERWQWSCSWIVSFIHAWFLKKIITMFKLHCMSSWTRGLIVLSTKPWYVIS